MPDNDQQPNEHPDDNHENEARFHRLEASYCRHSRKRINGNHLVPKGGVLKRRLFKAGNSPGWSTQRRSLQASEECLRFRKGISAGDEIELEKTFDLERRKSFLLELSHPGSTSS